MWPARPCQFRCADSDHHVGRGEQGLWPLVGVRLELQLPVGVAGQHVQQLRVADRVLVRNGGVVSHQAARQVITVHALLDAVQHCS